MISRTYGPSPLIIPEKRTLTQRVKKLNLRVRNAFSEDERLRATIIRDEIKQLLNELY